MKITRYTYSRGVDGKWENSPVEEETLEKAVARFLKDTGYDQAKDGDVFYGDFEGKTCIGYSRSEDTSIFAIFFKMTSEIEDVSREEVSALFDKENTDDRQEEQKQL